MQFNIYKIKVCLQSLFASNNEISMIYNNNLIIYYVYIIENFKWKTFVEISLQVKLQDGVLPWARLEIYKGI